MISHRSDEPAVTRHFLFQLPLTPAGIAQCYHITGRAPSLRYGSQNIKRPAQAPLVANVQNVLATPIKRMQNETTQRSDRTAAPGWHIRPLVAGEVEQGQQVGRAEVRERGGKYGEISVMAEEK